MPLWERAEVQEVLRHVIEEAVVLGLVGWIGKLRIERRDTMIVARAPKIQTPPNKSGASTFQIRRSPSRGVVSVSFETTKPSSRGLSRSASTPRR